MQDSLRSFKAEFFKALAHPVRIRILELLRGGEMSVTALQETLGLEASTVSQHLSVLRHKAVVDYRKTGSSVFYRVRDAEIFNLLDSARRIFNSQLQMTRTTLEQMAGEDETSRNEQAQTSAAHPHTPLNNDNDIA